MFPLLRYNHTPYLSVVCIKLIFSPVFTRCDEKANCLNQPFNTVFRCYELNNFTRLHCFKIIIYRHGILVKSRNSKQFFNLASVLQFELNIRKVLHLSLLLVQMVLQFPSSLQPSAMQHHHLSSSAS